MQKVQIYIYLKQNVLRLNMYYTPFINIHYTMNYDLL